MMALHRKYNWSIGILLWYSFSTVVSDLAASAIRYKARGSVLSCFPYSAQHWLNIFTWDYRQDSPDRSSDVSLMGGEKGGKGSPQTTPAIFQHTLQYLNFLFYWFIQVSPFKNSPENTKKNAIIISFLGHILK